MGLQIWLPLNKKEFQDQPQINSAVFNNNKSSYYIKENETFVQCNNNTVYNENEIYYTEKFQSHGLYRIDYLVNNNATFNPVGKLGGCYNFNGTNSKIYTELLSNLNLTNLTLSFWFKANTLSSTQYLVSLNAGGGYADHVIGAAIDGGKLVFVAGGASTVTQTITTNTWYHFAVTLENTVMKAYLNGRLVGESNCNRLTNKTAFTIGARASSALGAEHGTTYYFNGSLCDVRLYDEVLYKKEIKDLSLGLLLHYKLQDNKISGVTNLGGTAINYSNKILDTEYPLQNYDGTNSPSTVKFYNSGGYNNYPYKVYHKVHDTAQGNDIYGVFDNTTLSDIYLEGNKYYTMSCYIRATENLIETGGFLLGIINIILDEGFGISEVKDITTDWQRVVQTFYVSEDMAGYYKEYSVITQDLEQEYNIYYSGFQIEEGTIVNPFTLTNYNYPCLDSGDYKYNGLINGQLKIDNDKQSTIFNNDNAYIAIPSINCQDFSNSYTFMWWEYCSVINKMPWGFKNGNRLNLYHINPICLNTGDGAQNPFKNSNNETINPSTLLNQWHHITITGNGLVNQLYIDGQLFGSSTKYVPITGTDIVISGWDFSNKYKWNGKLKDFRIYTTVLTDVDILDLYHSLVKIEKNGVLYSHDFIEYGIEDLEYEDGFESIDYDINDKNTQISINGELYGAHFSELNSKVKFFKDNDIGIDENKLNEI